MIYDIHPGSWFFTHPGSCIQESKRHGSQIRIRNTGFRSKLGSRTPNLSCLICTHVTIEKFNIFKNWFCSVCLDVSTKLPHLVLSIYVEAKQPKKTFLFWIVSELVSAVGITPYDTVLRIRIRIFSSWIPDSGFASKNLSILTQKIVSKLS
jgi:hypothetical protein